MSKVSVIIPACNELFLPQTVNDVLTKARGDVEAIAILDNYWPSPILPDHPNLTVIHLGRRSGMRAAINAGAAVAKGKYLLKCDAHCMFAEGYDVTLQSEIDDDWIVIPSRYSLDAENWCIQQNGKSRVDYHYLCYPFNKKDDVPGLHGVVWNERARERKDKPEFEIDDEMSFQGSSWFMSRRHFHDFLGGMSEEGYGTFSQEPQEIGMKTWLGGGRVVTNKRTWYAHLHKGKQYGRMYSVSQSGIRAGHQYAVDFWLGNTWPGRVHDFEWLIDKFWPVPTWPENWREEVEKYRQGLANGKYYYPGGVC